MAAIHHLGFLKSEICNCVRFRGSTCVIMQNFMLISQIAAEIGHFSIFSKWRPSDILDLLCACMDHQWRIYHCSNLAGMDAVVSIIRTCWYLTCLA